MRRPWLHGFWILIALTPLCAAGAPSGVLTGAVHEKIGSTEKPAARIPVQLSIFKDDLEIAAARTQTDGAGKYRFTELETEFEYSYRVSAFSKNVPFETPPLKFGGTGVLAAPPLVTYPVTGSLARISADEIIFVEFGNRDLLRITHSVGFENAGEEIYDGRAEGGTPVEFTLPEGGFDLNLNAESPEDRLDLLPEANRIRMTVRVSPGGGIGHRLEYSYALPYGARELPLSFRANVLRSRVTVVSVHRDIDVESAVLTERDRRVEHGKTYYLCSGGPVAADEPLSFTLEGLPMKGDLPMVLTLGACGLIFLGLFEVWIRTRRAPRAAPNWNEVWARSLAELADLERHRRENRVSAENYESEKGRLRNLLFDVEVARRKSRAA